MTDYGKRIFELAINAPEVDIFNDEEVEVYIRRKAVELCLDPDVVYERAMEYDARLDDFKTACELSQ